MRIVKFKETDIKDYKINIFPIFNKNDMKRIITDFPESEKLIKNFGFKGKSGDILEFNSFKKSAGDYTVFIGSDKKIGLDSIRKLAKKCIESAKRLKGDTFSVHFTKRSFFDKKILENFIDYLFINSYEFDKYLSEKKGKTIIKKISIDHPGFRDPDKIIRERYSINSVLEEIRNFINDSPSVVNPDFVVRFSKKIAESLKNIKITVFSSGDLKKMEMNGLLSVGRSSPYSPALIKMEYIPDKFTNTISLVGKGITFDSGGLNIKTGSHMKTMKSDMSGAAAVLGIIKLASLTNLNIKIISYIPVAENMPGKDSYKPDDIIVFRNGKSVEIVNTDAEGRLVLADALILASLEETDSIIEFSTLTGSIVAALGESFSGLMCNSIRLKKELLKASEQTGERLWEMPLFQDYEKSISSEIADLKNADYGYASSIKAALFLNKFVNGKAFAHIDIAGTAYLSKKNEYISNTGATGTGVRLIYQYIKNLINN